MKKLFLAVIFIGFCGSLKAEPKTIDLGLKDVTLYVPFTDVQAVYQYDMRGKRSLLGAETPLFAWKRLEFTGGAVTSLDGKGAPFLGTNLMLENPTENWVPLASLHPGLFAGRDFRENRWIFGIKASKSFF